MKCPKCEYVNPDISHFCADCGTKLVLSDESPMTETVIPKEPLNCAVEGKVFAA